MLGPKLSTAELMITSVKAGESAIGADDESVACVDVAGAATCSVSVQQYGTDKHWCL